ncbi:MAG: hypothetical protein FJZ95_08010, partial [Chloroflexi bacterium]|nr:hypothetical protein [Chloroflexota bacterium]
MAFSGRQVCHRTETEAKVSIAASGAPGNSDEGVNAMEKIVYPIWKPENEPVKEFKHRLLGEVSAQLIKLGARRLTVNIVDEDVAPAEPLRIIATKPPSSGLICMWVDTAIRRKPLEEVIEKAVSRMTGYLVTESEPILNTKHPAIEGHRVHGMNSVVFLTKPPRLSHEQWLEIWHGSHTQIAIDTQSTFGYRQNVIVRPLTYAAPPYDAIVEEDFPAAAMADPMAFYNAVGDPAKHKKNEQTMIESCVRFI